MDLTQVPEWLGAAVAGAALAATGYMVKLILEWVEDVSARRRARRARLVDLSSLLRAGRVAFDIQSEHRDRLWDSIAETQPDLTREMRGKGFERLFAGAYPQMTERERELHAMVRTITQYTLRPINKLLLKWVREDTHFKARMVGRGPKARLAAELAHLEAHLLLWDAKYKVWIPDEPAHALVYLADEERHGVGFPGELQCTVETVLERRWWQGWRRPAGGRAGRRPGV